MHPSQKDFFEASDDTTDKVRIHGYHRFYPWFLNEFRGRPVRVLEIGLDQLGSVRLWNRYFASGIELHGIDRDEKNSDGAENVSFHKADQANPADLENFARTIGTTFEIIVDDGSHVPEHQLLSLKALWSTLAPGGIYILEDVETSYWGQSEIYGYDFDSTAASGNTIVQLRAAIDAVNIEFTDDKKRKKISLHPLANVLADIEMISFGQNCIILLKKDKLSFQAFYNRTYRFKNKIMSRSAIARGIDIAAKVTALEREISDLKKECETLKTSAESIGQKASDTTLHADSSR